MRTAPVRAGDPVPSTIEAFTISVDVGGGPPQA
jgi:hypothetical protein